MKKLKQMKFSISILTIFFTYHCFSQEEVSPYYNIYSSLKCELGASVVIDDEISFVEKKLEGKITELVAGTFIRKRKQMFRDPEVRKFSFKTVNFGGLSIKNINFKYQITSLHINNNNPFSLCNPHSWCAGYNSNHMVTLGALPKEEVRRIFQNLGSKEAEIDIPVAEDLEEATLRSGVNKIRISHHKGKYKGYTHLLNIKCSENESIEELQRMRDDQTNYVEIEY